MVTQDEQLAWTDGRYFDEAADDLDCNWWLMRQGQPGVPGILGLITTNYTSGTKVGANPKVISTCKLPSFNFLFCPLTEKVCGNHD